MLWKDIDIPKTSLWPAEISPPKKHVPPGPMPTAVNLERGDLFASAMGRLCAKDDTGPGEVVMNRVRSLSDDELSVIREVGERVALYDALSVADAPILHMSGIIYALMGPESLGTSSWSLLCEGSLRNVPMVRELRRTERWLLSTQCSFAAAMIEIVERHGGNLDQLGGWRVMHAATTARPHRPDWDSASDRELISDSDSALARLARALIADRCRFPSRKSYMPATPCKDIVTMARESGATSAFLNPGDGRSAMTRDDVFLVAASVLFGRLQAMASRGGDEPSGYGGRMLLPDGLSFHLNMREAVLPHGVLPYAACEIRVPGAMGACLPALTAWDNGLELLLVPSSVRTCDAMRRIYGMQGHDPLVPLGRKAAYMLAVSSEQFPEIFAGKWNGVEIIHIGTVGIGEFVGSDEPPSPDDLFHAFGVIQED